MSPATTYPIRKMRFNCTGCGECCRKVGDIREYVNGEKGITVKEYLKVAMDTFPYETDEDGVCLMLDQETNKCVVYEDRPLLCNLARIYREYPEVAESEAKWYIHNMEVCNFMMKMAGTPARFIIKKAYLI